MTIEALRSFRQGFAGCEIAVLADISAGTVLAWDGALKWQQEQLDGLCGMAARMLTPGSRQAVLIRDTGCHVFRRTIPDGGEALCYVLAPDAALEPAFAAAEAFCDHLRGADARARA